MLLISLLLQFWILGASAVEPVEVLCPLLLAPESQTDERFVGLYGELIELYRRSLGDEAKFANAVQTALEKGSYFDFQVIGAETALTETLKKLENYEAVRSENVTMAIRRHLESLVEKSRQIEQAAAKSAEETRDITQIQFPLPLLLSRSLGRSQITGDGNFLLAVDSQGEFFRWDLRELRSLSLLPFDIHFSPDSAVKEWKTSPDGASIVVYDGKQFVRWNLLDGTKDEIPLPRNANIDSMLLDSQGFEVDWVKERILIPLTSTRPSKGIFWPMKPPRRSRDAYAPDLSKTQISPDGSQIVGLKEEGFSSESGILELWDLLAKKKTKRTLSDDARLYDIDWKNRRALVSDSYGNLQLIDFKDRKRTQSLPHQNFKPDLSEKLPVRWDLNQALAGSEGGTIRLWDLRQNRPIREFKGHRNSIQKIEVSSDFRFALSTDYEDVILWDLSDETNYHVFRDHYLEAVDPNFRRAVMNHIDGPFVIDLQSFLKHR